MENKIYTFQELRKEGARSYRKVFGSGALIYGIIATILVVLNINNDPLSENYLPTSIALVLIAAFGLIILLGTLFIRSKPKEQNYLKHGNSRSYELEDKINLELSNPLFIYIPHKKIGRYFLPMGRTCLAITKSFILTKDYIIEREHIEKLEKYLCISRYAGHYSSVGLNINFYIKEPYKNYYLDAIDYKKRKGFLAPDMGMTNSIANNMLNVLGMDWDFIGLR